MTRTHTRGQSRQKHGTSPETLGDGEAFDDDPSDLPSDEREPEDAAYDGPRAAGWADWPAGPLDAAERAFGLLTRRPAPLAFDCHAIEGLPEAIIDLAELRDRLLARDRELRRAREQRRARKPSREADVVVPDPVADEVWRELVTRARRDGPAWVVAAVGMALPGMRRRAGLLARGWHGETADLDSEMLLGFLERLPSIDIDVPNICPRLIDAGAKAVKRSRHQAEDHDAIHKDTAESLPPTRPWDHADLVLARAVRAAVISAEDAALISQTRLDDVTLHQVADHLDVPIGTVAAWRYRAEHRLAAAIQAGELRWAPLPDAS